MMTPTSRAHAAAPSSMRVLRRRGHASHASSCIPHQVLCTPSDCATARPREGVTEKDAYNNVLARHRGVLRAGRRGAASAAGAWSQVHSAEPSAARLRRKKRTPGFVYAQHSAAASRLGRGAARGGVCSATEQGAELSRGRVRCRPQLTAASGTTCATCTMRSNCTSRLRRQGAF